MASGGGGAGTIGGGGGSSGPIDTVYISSATVLSASAFGKYIACLGSSAYAVTLPSAIGQDGRTIGVRIDSGMTNLVSVTAVGGQLIDGQAVRIMWAGEAALLQSDGANWIKLSGKSIPMVCAMKMNSLVSVVGGNPPIPVPWNQTDIDNTGLMADPVTNHRINFVRPGNYKIDVALLAFDLAADGSVDYQTLYGAVFLFAGVAFGKSGGNASLGDSQMIFIAALNPYTCTVTSGVNCSIYGDPAGNGSRFSAVEVPSW